MGNQQLMGLKIRRAVVPFTLRIRCSHLGYGKHDSTYHMLVFRDRLQKGNCDNQGSGSWQHGQIFRQKKLSELASLQGRFQELKISHIPRAQNKTVDSLVRTARFFHKSFSFY